MRIAIIADIHGNLPALDIALADMGSRRVDRVLCLGDIAAFGPQPREVVDRLRALGCPVVMGDTDAWLLDPRPEKSADADAACLQEIELWCAGHLADDDRVYLPGFAPTVELALPGGRTLLGYHGSPVSFRDRIGPATPDEAIAPLFADALAHGRALVLAGGHTHVQMVRRYRGVLLLNPGSVGLPYDVVPPAARVLNPTWAEYAIVECGEGAQGGELAIELRRVPYALAVWRAAVEGSGMPHAAWLLADWIDAAS
jgi:predicted phosphodiesterase